MSKSASNELHALIHKMTKAEKAAFKLQAFSRKGGKELLHVKLFDIIEKQAIYDELKAKKKMGSISPFYFASTKVYLYKNLLDSLVVSFEEDNYAVDFMKALVKIEILLRKGLYDQCKKLISRTKEEAIRLNHHETLAALGNFEAEIMIAISYKGIDEQKRKNVYDEIIAELNNVAGSVKYNDLVTRIFLLRRRAGIPRTREQLIFYKNILEHDLLTANPDTLNFSSRLSYYLLKSLCYGTLFNYNKAIINDKALIQLLENNPRYIAQKPRTYITALNNLIVNLKLSYRLNEIPMFLNKIQHVGHSDASMREEVFILHNYLKLEYYINTGDFDEGFELCLTLEKKIKQITSESHLKIVLFYAMAYTFLGAGKYHEANKYINRIINSADLQNRTDLYSFARIMQLIIHFELGNEDLADSLLKSVYRTLYKKNMLYKFESELLEFIGRRLRKIVDQKELLKAFTQLKERLQIITKDDFERNALNNFNLIAWLESKIQNKTLGQIVKSKLPPNS